MKFRFCKFYEIPTDSVFRWHNCFWQKTEQNSAIDKKTQQIKNFDTLEVIAVYSEIAFKDKPYSIKSTV